MQENEIQETGACIERQETDIYETEKTGACGERQEI